MRSLALILAVFLVAPACGRKKAPPQAVQPAVQAPVAPTTIKAPPGVPQALKSLFEREWPGILKSGDAFLEKFKEFESARGSGDRTLMSSLAAEAGEIYKSASDKWAEISYWAENKRDDGAIDEATLKLCQEFLGSYEKRVNDWTKKSKVLKEFTTAK